MSRGSIPGRVKSLPFLTASRPALGSTQPPIPWVPGAISPGSSGRDVKLPSYLHLVSRSRILELYLHFPTRLQCRDTFASFFYFLISSLINPLKAKWIINNIKVFSSYLTGNTLRLRYEAQPVNAVYGNSHCLLREPYGTHKYTLWAECRVLVC
jgi:hypothetical protein